MNITLTNLSQYRRRHVATVTIPTELTLTYGTECSIKNNNGTMFRAVKCAPQGSKTPFRVFTTLEPNEVWRGELLDAPYNPVPYAPHMWTSDDWIALAPQIGVKTPKTTEWTTQVVAFRVLEETPAHKRFWMRCKTNSPDGIIFECWMDASANDPVLNFWGKVVWSDRNDPKSSVAIQELFIRCQEYMAFDFSKAYGMGSTVKIGNWWTTSLGQNIPFIDGSAIPLSGRVLSFVSTPTTPAHTDNKELELDISSLKAAGEGPVLGVCDSWNGYWLANKNIATFPTGILWTDEAYRELSAFRNKLATLGSFYDTRALGLGKTPGQTGDQEDFGATKGTWAVLKPLPETIQMYQYSVYADLFRGFMFYEANGNPLSYLSHPNWVTWNGVTHWHQGVSPDRLGKTSSDALSVTTYYGYDDEHRSQLNLVAYIALTDDPLAADIIPFIVNTDMASYRMRYPTYGYGAARAQGRCAQTWANYYTVTPGNTTLTDISNLIESRWKALNDNPDFSATKEVSTIGYHEPDGRKPIFDANGNLLPTWSIWEHALAVVGFYQAYKVLPSESRKILLQRLMETVVKWGCFCEGDPASPTWWTIDDMWYRNGAAITDQLTSSSKQFTMSKGNGVGRWTLAAIGAAAEFLPDGPIKLKAINCYNALLPLGGDRREMEWKAIIRR